jgi:hypothetical protein
MEIDHFLTEFLDDPREKYSYFCYALLQGKVFAGFQVLKDKLMLKLQDKILQEPKVLHQLIAYLQAHKVASRQTFLAENKRATALKIIVCSVVDEKYRQKALGLWPKLLGMGTNE